MITVNEAAEKLGLAPLTVRKLCRKGQIPGAQKLGGNWVLPDDPIYSDRRVPGHPFAEEKSDGSAC